MSCILPPKDLRKEISNSFINFFQDSTENSWFMALGNILPWNFPRELIEEDLIDTIGVRGAVGTEQLPQEVLGVQTEKTKYDFYRTCTAMKKIFINDLSFIVKKNKWQPNFVYSAYRYDENMFDESRPPHYVFHNNSVYVCIENNQGSPSTVAPDSDALEYFTTTTDNYTWKKICEINQSELSKFEVRGNRDLDSFIPVRFINFEPGPDSPESRTKNIQDNAVFGSLSSVYLKPEFKNRIKNDSKISIVSGDGLPLINPSPQGSTSMSFPFFGEDNSSFNTLKDMFVQVINGTGKDQIRKIKSSQVVSNEFQVEIDPLNEGLSSDSKIYILPGLRIFGDGESRNPVSVKDTALQTALAIPEFDAQNILIGCRLLDIGKNYSFARAFAPKGFDWVDIGINEQVPEDIFSISLAPQGGHGNNCLSELGASNINLKTIFTDDDASSITPINDFRQIALIKNPTFFENTLLVRIVPPTTTLDVGDEIGLKTGPSENPNTFGKIVRKFPTSLDNTLPSYEFLIGEIEGEIQNFTHMEKDGNSPLQISPDDGLELIKFAGSENKLIKEFIMADDDTAIPAGPTGITLDRFILLGIGDKERQLVPSFAAAKVLSRSLSDDRLIFVDSVKGNFNLGEKVRAFSPDGLSSHTFTLEAIREPISDVIRSSYNMNTILEVEFDKTIFKDVFVTDQILYFIDSDSIQDASSAQIRKPSDFLGTSPQGVGRSDFPIVEVDGEILRPKAIGILFDKKPSGDGNSIFEVTGLKQKSLDVGDKLLLIDKKTSQVGFLNINKITEPKILYGSGEILYVQNFLPIERNFGKTEEVNLVIGI